jgi:two-component system response regulator PilR (NtrC family)
MARKMLINPIRTIAMIRIMILDDEKLIRWSLDRILAQDGYEIDTAATTSEALTLAGRSEYALIITDLEICGDQARPFFADMISKQPRARIVALTALAKDEAEKMLGGIATYAIIEKPFRSESIRAIVHAAIEPMTKNLNISTKENVG